MTNIPINLIQVFDDIEFISKVKKDEKICFKSRTYISKNSWYGSYYRMQNSESGENCADVIKNISINITNELAKNISTNLYDIIEGKIKLLQSGILILKDTYKNNTIVVNKLDESLILLKNSIFDIVEITHYADKSGKARVSRPVEIIRHTNTPNNTPTPKYLIDSVKFASLNL